MVDGGSNPSLGAEMMDSNAQMKLVTAKEYYEGFLVARPEGRDPADTTPFPLERWTYTPVFHISDHHVLVISPTWEMQQGRKS